MAKIKGWEKSNEVRDDFKEIRWDNTKSANSISVVFDGSRWRVWLHDVFGYDEELNKKGFNTKKQALDYAYKYMRSHPNG